MGGRDDSPAREESVIAIAAKHRGNAAAPLNALDPRAGQLEEARRSLTKEQDPPGLSGRQTRAAHAKTTLGRVGVGPGLIQNR